VRELQNAIEHAVVLGKSSRLFQQMVRCVRYQRRAHRDDESSPQVEALVGPDFGWRDRASARIGF